MLFLLRLNCGPLSGTPELDVISVRNKVIKCDIYHTSYSYLFHQVLMQDFNLQYCL